MVLYIFSLEPIELHDLFGRRVPSIILNGRQCIFVFKMARRMLKVLGVRDQQGTAMARPAVAVSRVAGPATSNGHLRVRCQEAA